MNRLVQLLLLKVSGHDKVQSLLQRTVSLSQSLMGIGAGSEVDTSGEVSVCDAIRLAHTQNQSPLCIFDVGANKGQFLSLVLGRLHGVPLVVHAFEPGQQTFGMLCQNIGSNPAVRLNQCALSQQPGEAILHYAEAGSGLASLSNRRLDHFGIHFDRTETVRLDTVDAYSARENVEQIDWLKLDVEGHELEVLRGATGMLSQGKIKRITLWQIVHNNR